MIHRLTCTVTGSVIDEQVTTRRDFYVSCGKCGYCRNQLRVGMFADAEQHLAEHFVQAHGLRPEFHWSERMTSVMFSEAARAINRALGDVGLPTLAFKEVGLGPLEPAELPAVRRNFEGQATVVIAPLAGRSLSDCLLDLRWGAVQASLSAPYRCAEVVIVNAIDRELERAYLVPKVVVS